MTRGLEIYVCLGRLCLCQHWVTGCPVFCQICLCIRIGYQLRASSCRAKVLDRFEDYKSLRQGIRHPKKNKGKTWYFKKLSLGRNLCFPNRGQGLSDIKL